MGKMNEADGKKLLFTVADVLEDIGVEFFLYAGTLLGAIREKRFIETDRDIDLAMMIENLLPVAEEIGNRLIEKGIRIQMIDHRHRESWTGGLYAIKIYGERARTDLIGFMKIQGKRAVPSHLGRGWAVHTAKLLEELDKIEFYGRTFKIPKDINGILIELYGDDWRTPVCRGYAHPYMKPESWRVKE